MKSTGIVRRIDDLGRVVIPKEARRTLGIREGDPLEMCVENGAIVYRKYYPESEYVSRLRDIRTDITDDMDLKPETRQALISGIDAVIKELEEES